MTKINKSIGNLSSQSIYVKAMNLNLNLMLLSSYVTYSLINCDHLPQVLVQALFTTQARSIPTLKAVPQEGIVKLFIIDISMLAQLTKGN